MAIYHIASDSDLASLSVSAGDTVLFVAGRAYRAGLLPANIAAASNVTIGAIGTGAKPIISAGTVRSDWTFDAGNNVYSRPAYAHALLGNVTEDGVPMKFVAWNTDIATTAALMTAGANAPHWAGSMSIDFTNRIVYIRPSAGVAADHQYIVADDAPNGSGSAISSSASATGLSINDIEVRHVPRHGIALLNKRRLRVSGVDFRYIGGKWESIFHLGNGLEISEGCHDVEVAGCSAVDVFDSGFTSQLYGSAGASLSWHTYADNEVTRCGMHGIELSVQSANNKATDILIDGLTAIDGGQYAWSGDRQGAAVSVVSNAAPTGVLTRCFARHVTAARQRRIYIGSRHNGVCGIEDSSATGSLLSAVSSNADAPLQTDLHRNLVDTAGAPSGSAWRQVSAVLSLSRSSLVL